MINTSRDYLAPLLLLNDSMILLLNFSVWQTVLVSKLLTHPIISAQVSLNFGVGHTVGLINNFWGELLVERNFGVVIIGAPDDLSSKVRSSQQFFQGWNG